MLDIEKYLSHPIIKLLSFQIFENFARQNSERKKKEGIYIIGDDYDDWKWIFE